MIDKVPKVKKRKDPEEVVEARRSRRKSRSDEWQMSFSSTLDSYIEEENK